MSQTFNQNRSTQPGLSGLALKAIERARENQDMREVGDDPIDTVEDMLELAEEVQYTKRHLAIRFSSLGHDFDSLSDEHKQRVISHYSFLKDIGHISNKDWEAVGLDVVDAEKEISPEQAKLLFDTDRRYSTSLIRPNWEEHFPGGKLNCENKDRNEISEGEAHKEFLKWQEFKQQFPIDMQAMLEGLRSASERLHAAHENPQLLEEFEKHGKERYAVMMSVSGIRSCEKGQRSINRYSAQLRASLEPGQPIPRSMQSELELLEEAKKELEQEKSRFIIPYIDMDSRKLKPELSSELARRARLDDARALRKGLLPTEEITGQVNKLIPQALNGSPIMLVGETGGAKTAAAEFMAQEINRQLGRNNIDDYEFVSGYGQLNSYQIMGKEALRHDENGTYSEFVYGAVARAMRDGKPVIIDEANAIDPNDLMKRFNRLLQVKPGDRFQIQEDSGETIEVKPGFCIIFTINEKSSRYSNVHDFSADLKSRFGSNVARIEYPDLYLLPGGQKPNGLMRLAIANIVNRYGEIPDAIDPQEVERFVQACHRLQRMFCIPASELDDAEKSGIGAEFTREASRTPLKQESIQPRLMSSLLQKLVNSLNSSHPETLGSILKDYVSGITNQADRQLIMQTLDEWM